MMKNKFFLLVILFVFLGAMIGISFFVWQEQPRPKSIQKAPAVTNPNTTNLPKNPPPAKPGTSNLPETFNIDLPFITQAPFRAWTEYPFNHTCEEATVLMLHYYLSGKQTVVESTIREELLAMVDFENQQYGFSDDTNAAETAQLIRDYYKYDVRLVYDFSIEDIKKELVKGNPVIVPTLGRRLENPYFTPPGPFYHMLVIKGYDAEGFITHDPGTYTKGVDYKYSFDILESAIHDFTKDNTEGGKKVMIVVEK